MIKILFVEEFKTTGGEEEVVFNLFQSFYKRDDFEVYVAAPPKAAYYKKNSFPSDRFFSIPMASKFDIRSVREIRRFILDQGIDIVHSHGDRAGLIARIACASTPAKSVWTMHANSDDNRITQSNIKRCLKVLVQRVLNKYFTDLVVCVSKSLRNNISSYMCHNKITVVYNGIDVERFSPKKKKANSDSVLRVLFAGRLSEQKGIPYLIEGALLAKKKGVDFNISLAGEGDLERAIVEKINENELGDCVSLLGFRKDISQLLCDHDVLLLPSLFEGFPVIILESLASGTPVIASKVNGIPEIINDKINGLLLEPGSSQDVANALEYVSNHRDWLHTASIAALDSVQPFCIETMVENHAKVYQKLASEN